MAADDRVRDEDRLPWLDTIGPEDPSPARWLRVVLIVLVAIALVIAVAWGVVALRTNDAGGNGALIAAQEGDYKIKPDDPGGLKVEGEGDSAIAASGGGNTAGAIDLRAVPEAPVTATRSAPRPAASASAGAASTHTAVPATATPLTAKNPRATVRPPVPGGASGGALVQLGAFPTEAAANTAWSAVARRFQYVASLGKSVQQAEVNGRKVYRLRVNAGSAGAAADICGRLRVAGESCFVTG